MLKSSGGYKPPEGVVWSDPVTGASDIELFKAAFVVVSGSVVDVDSIIWNEILILRPRKIRKDPAKGILPILATPLSIVGDIIKGR